MNPTSLLPDIDQQLRDAGLGLRAILEVARKQRDVFAAQAAEFKRLNRFFSALSASTNAANLSALIGAAESRLSTFEEELTPSKQGERNAILSEIKK